MIASQDGSVSVTIPSGASVPTAGTDLNGAQVTGIIFPAAWTAAALSFLVSDSLAGTYAPLYDKSGTEVTVPSASIATGAVSAHSLDIPALASWRFVKVRSGINGAAVNQGADRVLTLITRPV